MGKGERGRIFDEEKFDQVQECHFRAKPGIESIEAFGKIQDFIESQMRAYAVKMLRDLKRGEFGSVRFWKIDEKIAEIQGVVK